MEMFDKTKPYLAMISLQFGYAGYSILTKISLNEGMSHSVLSVYRSVVGTIVFAPFAFLLERDSGAKLTLPIFCQIFALSLLGPLNNNLYYVGLKFTSPTFGGVMINLVPVTIFALAFIFRMENIRVGEIPSQAKIVGTLVCVSGVMLITFYKGSIVPIPWPSSHDHFKNHDDSNIDIGKGCLCLIASYLCWASLFFSQAWVRKKYPAPLSLTTLVCLNGSLQSTIATLAVQRGPSVWAIGFDMKLLTAVYSGAIITGGSYYLQGLWGVNSGSGNYGGPVFVTAFFLLVTIITAIMDSFILHQRIYLGSVLGAMVIVTGSYGVLWGKMKDTNQTCREAKMDGHVDDAGL